MNSVTVPQIDISKITPEHHEEYKIDIDIDRMTTPDIKTTPDITTWQCPECTITLVIDKCPLCFEKR